MKSRIAKVGKQELHSSSKLERVLKAILRFFEMIKS